MVNIVSPHATIRGELQGENCRICDDVIVQERAKLGSNIFIMDNAIVCHRSVIEDHSFIGIKAAICGTVLIGAHSKIFDEVRVGKKCLIGGATIVKRNVPDCSVVKTPNDTMIIKQYHEDVIESKWQAHHNIRQKNEERRNNSSHWWLLRIRITIWSGVSFKSHCPQ